jgi:hypothetical protein
VKTFDIAVQSSVHLAVRLPHLRECDQKHIFNLFVNDISKEDMKFDEIAHWLGRQIRNILSSAINLARAEKRHLELADIKRMWRTTKVFQSYLARQTDTTIDKVQ